jgi:hypothetical protein
MTTEQWARRGSGQDRFVDEIASRPLVLVPRANRVQGARAYRIPWLEKAQRRLDTAEAIAADDPESAFVLADYAARFAGEVLLAQQGLRPTQSGGHLAVSDAVAPSSAGR